MADSLQGGFRGFLVNTLTLNLRPLFFKKVLRFIII